MRRAFRMVGTDLLETRMTTIRHINVDDAQNFLDLCLRLDSETSLMMYERGERTTSVAEQRDEIIRVLAAGNSTIIVAENVGELGGYVAASGGEFNRVRHVAHVVAGVRQSFAGQGIGTQLFHVLDDWASSSGIRRLELTVRVDNAPAIQLYTRMGYEIEGTRHRSLCVNGQFIDELSMAKNVDP